MRSPIERVKSRRENPDNLDSFVYRRVPSSSARPREGEIELATALQARQRHTCLARRALHHALRGRLTNQPQGMWLPLPLLSPGLVLHSLFKTPDQHP
jgi:hypothetical protein